MQVPRNAHEGAHVFLGRRRIHQHNAAALIFQAIIFAE